MTVPAHENGSLAALRVEVPDFPCNPPGYPRQWMQDTLVSAFHPEEARPVPSTKGQPGRSRLAGVGGQAGTDASRRTR